MSGDVQAVDEGPQIVDISNSVESWEVAAPDAWFSASHFKGVERVLTVKAVEKEEIPGEAPRSYLRFEESISKLSLSNEHKLILSELFGKQICDCVGHKITITAAKNWMRQWVIRILPRRCDGIDERPQLELAPPPVVPQVEAKPKARARRKRSTDEVNDK